MVKADGYGHGDEACAEAALAGGATRLAVATAAEAERIGRRLAHVPLLTMGALAPEELDTALEAGSEVAVWRRGFLDLVAARARAHGRPARVHVKYDSGMGRLGNRDPDEVLGPSARLCRERRPRAGRRLDPLRHRRRTGVRASSTSSSTASPPLAEAAKGEFPAIVVHAANSAAVFRERRSHFDMARCGVAVYGLDPFQGDPAERGSAPGALAALLCGRRQAPSKRATAPATDRPGGPSAIPASACCRSATATASGVASPTTPRCSSAAAAFPWSARSRWTT